MDIVIFVHSCFFLPENMNLILLRAPGNALDFKCVITGYVYTYYCLYVHCLLAYVSEITTPCLVVGVGWGGGGGRR